MNSLLLLILLGLAASCPAAAQGHPDVLDPVVPDSATEEAAGRELTSVEEQDYTCEVKADCEGKDKCQVDGNNKCLCINEKCRKKTVDCKTGGRGASNWICDGGKTCAGKDKKNIYEQNWGDCMAATVENVAEEMEALAGEDGDDGLPDVLDPDVRGGGVASLLALVLLSALAMLALELRGRRALEWELYYESRIYLEIQRSVEEEFRRG